ncbi:DUF6703 family protein [Nocardiopsis ansamitocini]|uniref:Uncharacterized protein n=1 Tax=Nocardiopsis ansamitocini TaxID=1670832 RepID=A0A9W6P388_9ACTN|nr:DUF6703 family protein [Nocardiopsis ansamitocini]GLU46346.1 hypothetical protein Nans01_06970 [Nocardiopsis ansamitocini]
MSPKREKPDREGPSERPLPPGTTLYTPGASPLRRAIEKRSAVPLLVLHNAPRWVLPVAMVGVFFSGLMLAGVAGALLLGLIAAFFAWLTFLGWPRLQRSERAMRCIVAATLLGLGILQSGLF